jgi:hypothetical protein
MMSDARYFRRLEWATALIARHPTYPGKQGVVQQCLEEIEDRFRQGTLSSQQRSELLSILMSGDRASRY